MATTEESSSTVDDGFVQPVRQVFQIFDMSKWYRSYAYEKYLTFVQRINDSVIGVTNYDHVFVSDRIQPILNLIDTLDNWMNLFPPEAMADQRFGNKAFRHWYAKFAEEAEKLVKGLLPPGKKDASAEITPYLLDSFGNSTRIDYGSGHEAAFLMFLCCLYHVGSLKEPDDDKAVVLKIFRRYLKFCRKLQSNYRMEPAGSRGVHAIDDYQFAPFIFGSAQLIGNKQRFIPDHYLNEQTVANYQNENLFFEAIQYINDNKFGPFYEHSNQLYNISSVATWEKVNSGMFKMYEGECLKKFPVAQHFLFGSILSINQRPCFVEQDAATKAALQKDKEEAERSKERQAHLIDSVKPMEAIVED
uniref:Serine/threonine-protein phosphatase 2A activator n=1 Tax=Panagrolaimus sp. JU765 TaxID=591449 RepID=A0AC34QVL0_9BILA